MEWYHYVLIGVGALFVALVLVIIIRALLFNDKTVYVKETDFEFEDDEIVKKLGTLIKIPTISHQDESLMDMAEFDRLVKTV